jgi:hypothetical protein
MPRGIHRPRTRLLFFALHASLWTEYFSQWETRRGIQQSSPSRGLLDLADVHFTGHHCQSRRDGTTIVIAETERTAGHVDAQVLDALAEVAVWLPRP